MQGFPDLKLAPLSTMHQEECMALLQLPDTRTVNTVFLLSRGCLPFKIKNTYIDLYAELGARGVGGKMKIFNE